MAVSPATDVCKVEEEETNVLSLVILSIGGGGQIHLNLVAVLLIP